MQSDKLRQRLADVKALLANKENEAPEKLRQEISELQQQSLKLFEMAYKKVRGLLLACWSLSFFDETERKECVSSV